MPNPNNYRYYDTVADMKSSDTPLAGDWAKCDGYAETGDGGGGWFRFETGTAPAPAHDEGLTFEHTVTAAAAGATTVPVGWYRRMIEEGHYNARWWGARGNGLGNDQPELQAAAAAAQRDGIALYIPAGEYRVQPNTPSRRIIEITAQNFRVYGDGANVTSIKIGNSGARTDVGGIDYSDYFGFFIVDDYDTDASGFHLSDLTLNADYDANIITSEDQLKGGTRRAGVEIRNGTGITVERCRFLDFPRQALHIVTNGPNRQVLDVKVLHNECRTVTADTGTVAFDVTPILIRADGLLIEGNRVIGNPANYYLSRTAIQGTGNDVRIIANEITRFHRGILVGTGEGDARIVIGNSVIGNTMRDMNGGIEINVQAGQSDADPELNGYAMRNCIVQGNSIHLNKVDYSLGAGDFLMHGILLRTGSDADIAEGGTGDFAVDGLKIIDNQIYSSPGNFDAGSGLIELNSYFSGNALTVPNRNWTVAGNTIVSPPRRGITLAPKGIVNASIRDNKIVNLGQRANVQEQELNHRCGIRYIGSAVDAAVRINGNLVVDDRATTITEAAVYVSGGGCDDLECLDNHVVLADARNIPVVETTSASTTPFIRARTGKMSFVAPASTCRYGSTIIDEATGKTRVQATAPAGTNWKEAAALV